MTLASRSDELIQFKTEINLCEYLAEQGFQLDRRNSSRCSAVMRNRNGDKLIVARTPSRIWIYFNVHGDDSGTIIDFAQRDGANLGEVRRRLRPWIGRSSLPQRQIPSFPKDLQPSTRDWQEVHASWARSTPISLKNAYLQSRHIPPEIYRHPRFQDRIRTDSRGNVLFGHWTDDGLSGYEVKNRTADGRSFTGFAPGGTKGLFFSSASDNDAEMLICETAIDLLSLATIRGIEGRRWFSVGGQVSPLQLSLIVSAAKKMPDNGLIKLAMDNDGPGRELASRIAEHLSSAGISAQRISLDLPAGENTDWNDELRVRLSHPPPEFDAH